MPQQWRIQTGTGWHLPLFGHLPASHPGQNASNLENVQKWRHRWLTDKQICSALPQNHVVWDCVP